MNRSGVFLVRAWTEGHGFRARMSCVGDDGRPPAHEVTADADEVGRILRAWVIALRDSQHRTDCMPRGSGNVQAQNRESDVIDFVLRRAQNLAPRRLTVDKMARAARNGHKPCVVWFSGPPDAGKTTIADLVERKLHADGVHTYVLDGDNMNNDLEFTHADRVENIRRIAETAALMVDAGLVVLVTTSLPLRAGRVIARELVDFGEFCDVHVDAPSAATEQCDQKRLYAEVGRGETVDFAGVESQYEPPTPDLRLNTSESSLEAAAEVVIAKLRDLSVIPASAG